MIIYPKNKEHFKKLIPFAQNIIKILDSGKIKSVIYGSFAHFYHTKDPCMKVNDIDIIIDKEDFDKVCKILDKNKVNYRYHPEWPTLIIKKGKLKVEIDALGKNYKTLKESRLPAKFDIVNFYGLKVKVLTLKDIEEIYPVAYRQSNDSKPKILRKIKHLEKFLGRKLL